MKNIILTLCLFYSFNALAFFKDQYSQEELNICEKYKIYFNEDKFFSSYIISNNSKLNLSKFNFPKRLLKNVKVFNICLENKKNELDFLNCIGKDKRLNIKNPFLLQGKTIYINKFIKQTNKTTGKVKYFIISYESIDKSITNNLNSIYEIFIIDYDYIIKRMPKLKQDLTKEKLFCNK